MYVCMYACMYVCMYNGTDDSLRHLIVYMYTYACSYDFMLFITQRCERDAKYFPVGIHMYAYAYTCMCGWICICMHNIEFPWFVAYILNAYIHTYIHTCIHTYSMCTHLCVCVCVHVYTYVFTVGFAYLCTIFNFV